MSSNALGKFVFAKMEKHFAGKTPTWEDVRVYCKMNAMHNAEAAYLKLTGSQHSAASFAVDPNPTIAEPDDHPAYQCPPSPLPQVAVPSFASNDPVLVMSDLHIPAHNANFIDAAVYRARREGCKSFVIAGDLTDSNQWHRIRGNKQHERTWQQDIELARSVMGYLCAVFPSPTLYRCDLLAPAGEYDRHGNVVFFGNHDEWIDNALKGQIKADWLYGHLFPDMPVIWSSFRQASVCGYMVVHGEKFSHANPLGIAEKYALHNERSVIMGHQHYAVQWRSGSYDIIINGGMFDSSRQAYLHEKPEPMRRTQNGYTIIKNGKARLWTD